MTSLDSRRDLLRYCILGSATALVASCSGSKQYDDDDDNGGSESGNAKGGGAGKSISGGPGRAGSSNGPSGVGGTSRGGSNGTGTGGSSAGRGGGTGAGGSGPGSGGAGDEGGATAGGEAGVEQTAGAPGTGGSDIGAGGAGGAGGRSGGAGTGAGGGTGGSAGAGAGAGAGGKGGVGGKGGGAGAGAGGKGGGAGTGGSSGGVGGTGGSGGMGGSGGGPTTGEDSGTGCSITVPGASSFATNPKLPDPFLKLSGSRITTKAEWTCRRAEIKALAQAYVVGTKPAKPSVTASFTGSTLRISCTQSGKTISFSVTISKPSGSGPFPLLIAVGGSSLPSLSGKGVATINLDNNSIGQEATCGSGSFFTLYGSSMDSGAMIAWAWGVSRIIDALELTPSAGIDATRIAVTGCSRNGRGAVVCGAFDERIVLTIPQEAGIGGTGSFRIADDEHANGKNIQTASEMIGEACWLGRGFDQFASSTSKLPIDTHSILAMCAPRALLVIENDIDWLGPVATYGAAKAAHKVYEALGVPERMGISLSANHAHCSFPSSQQAALDAFVTRYLLNGSANTTIDDNLAGVTYDEAKWIDWTTPTLG